ncbi:MAG: hypothetical protein ACTSX7_01525 [Alphaproteobacteria bacterium]
MRQGINGQGTWDVRADRVQVSGVEQVGQDSEPGDLRRVVRG